MPCDSFSRTPSTTCTALPSLLPELFRTTNWKYAEWGRRSTEQGSVGKPQSFQELLHSDSNTVSRRLRSDPQDRTLGSTLLWRPRNRLRSFSTPQRLKASSLQVQDISLDHPWRCRWWKWRRILQRTTPRPHPIPRPRQKNSPEVGGGRDLSSEGSLLTATSRSSLWPSPTPPTASWLWGASTSSSRNDSPSTGTTPKNGRTPSATTWLSTTASSRSPGSRAGQGKATTGLWTPMPRTCLRAAASWGAGRGSSAATSARTLRTSTRHKCSPLCRSPGLPPPTQLTPTWQWVPPMGNSCPLLSTPRRPLRGLAQQASPACSASITSSVIRCQPAWSVRVLRWCSSPTGASVPRATLVKPTPAAWGPQHSRASLAEGPPHPVLPRTQDSPTRHRTSTNTTPRTRARMDRGPRRATVCRAASIRPRSPWTTTAGSRRCR